MIRLGAFVGVFLVMASWETLAPRRRLLTARLRHWAPNLSLAVLDVVLLRAISSTGLVGVAMVSAERGWGVMNRLDGSPWLEGLLALLALDFVIYLQHLLFHSVPVLWRFHVIHHADPDYDATTGVRFHPVEAVLSLLIKAAAVVLIGASAVVVLAFEVLLNVMALFNHSNVRIPHSIDRVLRWVVVTPDMHRIHHSVTVRERNRNFGFNLPWWDYLFSTYLAEPAQGHQQMTIGVGDELPPVSQTLLGLLVHPFRTRARAWAKSRTA